MGFVSQVLGMLSGNKGVKVSDQLLFDKVIGFRGIVPGVGTSTIVQNTAIALSAKTNYSICVWDTHFLYPTMHPLLGGGELRGKDFLDFNGDLSEVIYKTQYKNVHLLALENRTLIDMLSSKDNEVIVDKLIGLLKAYFDVILIDLSYELTNLATHAAIKCNKVINVADQSFRCIYHLRKSLNLMATLAVPLAKANSVVLNKVLPDVLTNTRGVLQEAGLNVLGEIPFSVEIAKLGVAGKRVWNPRSPSKDIVQFSGVINSVVENIIDVTPLNKKYLKDVEDVDFSDNEKESSVENTGKGKGEVHKEPVKEVSVSTHNREEDEDVVGEVITLPSKE